MHLNVDQTILDRMSEGIIVLNHKAEVLRHNVAAEFWLPACLATRQAIRRAIAEDITCRVRLPVSVDFLLAAEPASSPGAQAWLSKSGTAEYLLIVFSPGSAESAPASPGKADVTGHHYLTLLGDQVQAKFEELKTVAEVVDMPPALQELTQQVESLLTEMGSLAMLLQRDQVFASDRMDLNALLQTSMQQLALEDARAGRYELVVDHANIGAIYGNAQWLTYAFEVLFFGLLRGMAPHTHLQISIRQVGDFVVVSGRDVPGIGKKPTTLVGALPSTAVPVCVSRDPTRLSTRMLMAQRILELHSGHLKIAFLPFEVSPDHELAAPIESFSVTLLTGLPLQERSRASCTQCPYTLQAQVYAQDMAALMETTD